MGIAFRPGDSPILYLDRPELRARLKAYELAERMQATAPEAVDLSKQSEATQKLYGLDDKTSEGYGRVLLRARTRTSTTTTANRPAWSTSRSPPCWRRRW